MKVFLGGTCAGSKWRDKLIPMLEKHNIEYFNPIVKNWDREKQLIEIQERQTCDFVLYTITPKMKGVYSIAEVVDDSNKRPEKTIFCVLGDFDKQMNHSLDAVKELVKNNGGQICYNLHDIVMYLLTQYKI